MLPIPHLLLFTPAILFALLFVAVCAMNRAVTALRFRAPKPAFSPSPRPSAQIIYFRPRQTSLPSTLDLGVRQWAMPGKK